LELKFGAIVLEMAIKIATQEIEAKKKEQREKYEYENN
jgi:hypothetical protein